MRTPRKLAVPLHLFDERNEQAVLGAMLISRRACDLALARIRSHDFALPPHRLIFDAMVVLLHRDPAVTPDPVTVCTALEGIEAWEGKNALEAAGHPVYINALADSVPTAVHVEHYLDTLEKFSLARHGNELCQDYAGRIANPETAREELYAAIQGLTDLGDRQLPNRVRIFDAAQLAAMEMPDVRYIVPEILPEGLFLLVGKAKQGKSWLAYQLAVAISSGGMALGLIPVEKGRVLYLALEDTKRRLKKRLLKITGESEAPSLLHFATEWRRANDGGIAEMDAWCRKYENDVVPPRLIIVDVFGKFRPIRDSKSNGNLYQDDYADMTMLKTVADRYGIAIIAIHHQNKGSNHADIADTFSGSTGMQAAADGWLVLQRERGQPFAKLEIDGRDIEDTHSLALEWDPRTIWTLRGDAEAFIHSKEDGEVLAILAPTNRSISATELGEILDIQRDTARKRLNRMEERGLLSSDRGAYRLSASFLANRERNEQVQSLVSYDAAVPAVPPYTNSQSDTRDTKDDRDSKDDPGREIVALHAPLELPDGVTDAEIRGTLFDQACAVRLKTGFWPAFQFVGPKSSVWARDGAGWRQALTRCPAEWFERLDAFLKGEME